MVTNPFDIALPSGGTVGEAVMAPLLERGVEPLVVDVGARNGMSLLPASYCRLAHLIGFEPNVKEFNKLTQGTTDAVEAGLPPPPSFRSERYHDCALWDADERRPFYLTVGVGACTLMGPSRPKVTDRMFLDSPDGRARQTYTELHTGVVKTEEVRCRALDQVVGDETIDFLKLDVEGAELRVLKGAKRLLESGRVLFIKSEFVCFGYYDEHPVFGEQHAFLNEPGFRLLDLDFEQPVYSRSPTRIPRAVDRRLKYAGDAYYALDPDRRDLDALDLHRLAAVSLTMGFRSFALGLLEDAGLLGIEAVSEIEKALSRILLKKRLLLAWRQFPFTVQRALSTLGYHV